MSMAITTITNLLINMSNIEIWKYLSNVFLYTYIALLLYFPSKKPNKLFAGSWGALAVLSLATLVVKLSVGLQLLSLN